MGSITIICYPACEQVIDNGVSLGKSPILARPVPAGKHTIQLMAGGAKKSAVLTVKPDENADLRTPVP